MVYEVVDWYKVKPGLFVVEDEVKLSGVTCQDDVKSVYDPSIHDMVLLIRVF